MQLSTLLSIKTGGCPEDCGYCPQAAATTPASKAQKLMAVDEVLARRAGRQGRGRHALLHGRGLARARRTATSSRCSRWSRRVKAPGPGDVRHAGHARAEQARALKDAGLDYYNHNLDTSPEYYGNIITTRTYQDRLDTLGPRARAGINVCCGGIVGMGETPVDRAGLIAQLANLDPYPESVPINSLVRVQGTPLADTAPVDPFDFVRTIAVARITMPARDGAPVRRPAAMDDAVQALCFLAGANSIFFGEKLLTTGNPQAERDRRCWRGSIYAPRATPAEGPLACGRSDRGVIDRS